MKITKIGFYKTRAGDLAKVIEIDDTKVFGWIIMGGFKTSFHWAIKDGRWLGDINRPVDIVEELIQITNPETNTTILIDNSASSDCGVHNDRQI